MAFKIMARTVSTARAGRDAVQVGQVVWTEQEARGRVSALAGNPQVIVAWYAEA